MLKLTMGKDAAHLKLAPLATLEPALFANSSMHAASSALANAARCTAQGPRPPRNAGDAAITDGSGSVGELAGELQVSARTQRPIEGSPAIAVEVGTCHALRAENACEVSRETSAQLVRW
jgi:hypothetical protein